MTNEAERLQAENKRLRQEIALIRRACLLRPDDPTYNRFPDAPSSTEVDPPEPEGDPELIEVLDAWATKTKKPSRGNISPLETQKWREALAIHAKAWCLTVIASATSRSAGWTIMDAEKNKVSVNTSKDRKCAVCGDRGMWEMFQAAPPNDPDSERGRYWFCPQHTFGDLGHKQFERANTNTKG